MADGSTKPISQLRPGDPVVATDPQTGRTTIQTVTAHIVGHDTEFTDIAVVDEHGTISIIHTTPHHRIWDKTANTWVDASALDPYHRLYTQSGGSLTVLAVLSFVGSQRMYNLTVSTVHTYYVVVGGTTATLVHNVDPVCTIEISRSRYPEAADHIEDAQANGQPSVLTIDRGGAASRRAESMRGQARVPGQDRDEYPPAMFEEGGAGASVRPINPGQNRGSGSYMGNRCRGLADGTAVEITVCD